MEMEMKMSSVWNGNENYYIRVEGNRFVQTFICHYRTSVQHLC